MFQSLEYTTADVEVDVKDKTTKINMTQQEDRILRSLITKGSVSKVSLERMLREKYSSRVTDLPFMMMESGEDKLSVRDAVEITRKVVANKDAEIKDRKVFADFVTKLDIRGRRVIDYKKLQKVKREGYGMLSGIEVIAALDQ